MQEFTKLLRVDEDAERILIGTILGKQNEINNICDDFKAEFLYNTFYQEIYKEIIKLDSEGKTVNFLAVSDSLKKRGYEHNRMDMVSLTDSYTFDSLYDISLLIKEKAIERELINISHDCLKSINDNEDVYEIIDDAIKKISKLCDTLDDSDSEPIKKVVDISLNNVSKRIERQQSGLFTGINTGLTDMNKMLGGWQNGDLIILAARPSVGKTAIALNFAKSSNVPVVFFSLEMAKESLTDRLLVAESHVNSENYRDGKLSESELLKVDIAAGKVRNYNITFDDRASQSINRIRSKARTLNKKGLCGMIIIDYLQLMAGERVKNSNREQEISTISRGAKQMARELNIPVILLSQLNRDCEKRENKKPMLADLRESGAIEQDADIVIFAYRPELYNIKVENDKGEEKNFLELIIAKHRNGSCGSVNLHHDGMMLNIYDYDTNIEYPF